MNHNVILFSESCVIDLLRPVIAARPDLSKMRLEGVKNNPLPVIFDRRVPDLIHACYVEGFQPSRRISDFESYGSSSPSTWASRFKTDGTPDFDAVDRKAFEEDFDRLRSMYGMCDGFVSVERSGRATDGR